jgi:lysophospholipase L1-like esterase
MVSAAAANADTDGSSILYTTFYHDGDALDIIQYGLGQSVLLYINDTFQARYGGALTVGLAQGGATSTITLAATSSTTSGYYNGYYARIVGGTGLPNEARRVVSYDATTAIATVDSAWTTAPDATTQYVIQEGRQPFVLDGSTGSIKYLHLNWQQSGQRKITIEQGIFSGAISAGAIAPAPGWSSVPALVVGDSFWEGDAAPSSDPLLLDAFALGMGWLPTNLGDGGTGFIAADSAINRLNFQDRIAPPTESWLIANSASGGTYTFSITLNGTTSVTDAIPYNANNTNIEAALNALANVVAVNGSFSVARGDFGTPRIVIGHGIPGATISVDVSLLTGGAASVLGNYTGEVAKNVPTNASGSAAPFYLLVVGSGNDSGSTDAEVQAASIYVAQQIVARFPTAMPIFVGVLGDCDAGTSQITAANISRNAAIAAGAALLPTIAGKIAFIDTYAAGLGQPKIIYGLGTIAEPQAGTNANLKSITDPGHPTGAGAQVLANWLSGQVTTLIGSA